MADPDQDTIPVKEATNPITSQKEPVQRQYLMKLNQEELEDRYLRLMEENTQLKKQCIDVNDKNKRLSARLVRLMDQEKPRLPVEARKNFQLQLLVDEQKAKISELEAANDRLTERLTVLKNQMAEHSRLHTRNRWNRTPSKSPLRARGSVISSPIREDTKTIEKLKSDNSALQEDIAALKKELEYVKMQNANRVLELEHKLAENFAEDQKKQLSENVEIMRLRRALKKQAAELGVMQTENQLRDRDLVMARKTVEELHLENEKLEKELAEKSNLVTELKYNLEVGRRDMRNVEELLQEIDDYKKEISTLKEYQVRLLSVKKLTEEHECKTDMQVTNDLRNKIKELENKLISESAEKSLLQSTIEELKGKVSKVREFPSSEREQIHISESNIITDHSKVEMTLSNELMERKTLMENSASNSVKCNEEQQKLSERVSYLERALEEERFQRRNMWKALLEEQEERDKKHGDAIPEIPESQMMQPTQVPTGVSCATQTDPEGKTEVNNERHFKSLLEYSMQKYIEEDAVGKSSYNASRKLNKYNNVGIEQSPSLKQSRAVMCPHFMVDKFPQQEDPTNLNSDDIFHIRDYDAVDESTTSASLEAGLPVTAFPTIHNTSLESNEDDTQVSAASNISLSAGEMLPPPHTASGAKLLHTPVPKKGNSKPAGANELDLAAAYMEKLQELTKYQELLRVQYSLNSAYKKEVSSLNQKLHSKYDNENRNGILNKLIETQVKHRGGTNTVREETLRRQHSIPLGYNQGIFELHIQRLALSASASFPSEPRISVSWIFYDQPIGYSPEKTGRDVLFDYSVVYRVEVGQPFLNYLMNGECILELQVYVDDVPQCIGKGSLKFSEILEYPQNKLHSSVQIMSTRDNDRGSSLGVLECWFRMKCSDAFLSKFKDIKFKKADITTNSSKSEDDVCTLSSEPSSSTSHPKLSRHPVPVPRSRQRKEKESLDLISQDIETVPDGVLAISVTRLTFPDNTESSIVVESTDHYVTCTLLNHFSICFENPGKVNKGIIEFSCRKDISLWNDSKLFTVEEFVNFIAATVQQNNSAITLHFQIFTKAFDDRVVKNEFGHADLDILKFMQQNENWIHECLPFFGSDGNQVGLLEVSIRGIIAIKRFFQVNYQGGTVEESQSVSH